MLTIKQGGRVHTVLLHSARCQLVKKRPPKAPKSRIGLGLHSGVPSHFHRCRKWRGTGFRGPRKDDVAITGRTFSRPTACCCLSSTALKFGWFSLPRLLTGSVFFFKLPTQCRKTRSMAAQPEHPRNGGFMARSGPVEIILRILQCCHSTRDLLALVSTCRHVCSVWRGNVAAELWPVWLREIPHFQDAVMAVSMGTAPPSCYYCQGSNVASGSGPHDTAGR
jgi:hypothetical protein